jgi:hypothetical protein
MEAGITDHVWSCEELIALLEPVQKKQTAQPKGTLWLSVKKQNKRRSNALVVSANAAACHAPYTRQQSAAQPL